MAPLMIRDVARTRLGFKSEPWPDPDARPFVECGTPLAEAPRFVVLHVFESASAHQLPEHKALVGRLAYLVEIDNSDFVAAADLGLDTENDVLSRRLVRAKALGYFVGESWRIEPPIPLLGVMSRRFIDNGERAPVAAAKALMGRPSRYAIQPITDPDLLRIITTCELARPRPVLAKRRVA